MDYKKIIRSRKMRLKILELLSFIPDKAMISFQYKLKTGRKLDLETPTRYTEKLQWYKLYYRDEIMIKCVDKFDVREYVINKGLEDILLPCYGVFDNVKDINWSSLPDQFVVKDTLGGGGTSVKVITDKETEDLDALSVVVDKWTRLNGHIKNGGREWPYYSGKNHRIIIEKFLNSNPDDGGLIDYKFLCFNGKAELLYVLADRVTGKGAGCGFFDLDFNQLDISESDEPPLKRKIKKPDNYKKMIQVAETLAADFPCARIDLYNQNGKITFGEITFFDSSGYMIFDPDIIDFELGEKFVLPPKNKKL